MLSACAAKKIPVENIMANLKLAAVVDDEHAILKKEPRKIDFNKKVSSSLSVGESIVRTSDNVSYYQVFEGESEFNGIVQFQLNSYCACLGFDKKIMIPLILLLDLDGNEIKVTNVNHIKKQASNFTPLHISLTGEFNVKKGQVFKIVVFAENSASNLTVSNTSIQNMQGTTLLNLRVSSYPLGDFDLELHKL